MKITHLLSVALLGCCGILYSHEAQADIKIGFQRNGTNANEVKVLVSDVNGNPVPGVTATLDCSHSLMTTQGDVTEKVICPNVNGNTHPEIKLTLNLKGLKTQPVKLLGLDLHALTASGGYQNNNAGLGRQFTIQADLGKTGSTLTNFGILKDIDLALNVGEAGNVHKIWNILQEQPINLEGDCQIVLTITAPIISKGCFIGLSEIVLAENEEVQPQEVCPFKSSPAVGKPLACYTINEPTGKCLQMNKDGKLSWAENSYTANQNWYFVETQGGYLIVNYSNNSVFNLEGQTNTAWVVKSDKENKGFHFLPSTTPEDLTTSLTIDGISTFVFNNVHNSYARHGQIYEIPCGVLGSAYITQLQVTGDLIKTMQYPLNTVVDNKVTTPVGAQPETEFYIYTEDQAMVAAGNSFVVHLQLNTAPTEGMEGFIYFDWNRDGIFEASQQFDLAQESTINVTAPANVKEGKSRVRIRLTDNGMKGSDQEVTGEIFDWMLHLSNAAPESYLLTAVANDETRGEVTATKEAGFKIPVEVKATPKGHSTFVCWKEGLQIVSLDPTYKFTLDHETQLMAYFSPNEEQGITGIEENFAEKSHLIDISTENKQLNVISKSQVKKILVFQPNGKLVAQSNQAHISLNGAAAGTYIVKVYTQTADETAKIILK